MITSIFFSNDSDPSKYVGIPQGTYALTAAHSPRPILFTCHVATCFAVSLYDKEKRMGALMHIDSLIDVSGAMNKIFQHFLKNKSNLADLEAHIIGGHEGCQEGEEVYCKIKKELNIVMVNTSENVFKKSFNHKKISRACKLLDQFNNPTYFNVREAILAEYNSLIKEKCYAQVALDTRTGEIAVSSQQKHLIEDPRSTCAYSPKAIQAQIDLEAFSEMGLQLCRKRKAEEFKRIRRPIVKIYNGTFFEDNVFSPGSIRF